VTAHRREVITSHGNATVRRLKSLRLKKYRREEGLFLAEGLRILLEALDAGRTPAILLHAAGREEHAGLARLVEATLAAGGEVLSVTAPVLAGVSGKDNPQMVLGAFQPFATPLGDLPLGVPRILAAERLRDPGNLGTLLRACDGAGAGALILVEDCADPFSVEAVRASMGAIFTVPIAFARVDELPSLLRTRGVQLIGAAIDARSTDYRLAAFPDPCCIVLGNEQQGLSEDLQLACDALVMIPMLGRADSLNVAMAGTLLIYEALRRQLPQPQ
jgi:TrmH family RNA methyltransferase